MRAIILVKALVPFVCGIGATLSFTCLLQSIMGLDGWVVFLRMIWRNYNPVAGYVMFLFFVWWFLRWCRRVGDGKDDEVSLDR